MNPTCPVTPAAPSGLDSADTRTGMQALVASGFNSLQQGEFLLLTFGDPALARAWLRRLLAEPRLVGTVADVSTRGEAQLDRVVALAFSHAGLQHLGLQGHADHAFPTTFRRGMGDALHLQALGDGDLQGWRWADVQAPGVPCAHLLLMHLWHSSQPAVHPLLDPAALQAGGITWCDRIAADPSFLDGDGRATEPFGFRDGLSQPVIRGLRGGQTSRHREIANLARPHKSDLQVAAGEFVLGHPNEYDQIAYAPDVTGYVGTAEHPRFGSNGSYVAVRQIRQDVAALRAFEASVPAPTRHGAPPGPLPPPTIAELMVGRRRNGQPLTPLPRGAAREAFRFRMADAHGFSCPLGAHVRRANPRDDLAEDIGGGLALARLHRLLRRGRSYLGGATAGEQGMFFMALNADLDRQFAFVQSQWIANPNFGGLFDEADPLLGQRNRSFTVQDEKQPSHHRPLPRFTEVVGGGYFLLPSLPALRFIAG